MKQIYFLLFLLLISHTQKLKYGGGASFRVPGFDWDEYKLIHNLQFDTDQEEFDTEQNVLKNMEHINSFNDQTVNQNRNYKLKENSYITQGQTQWLYNNCATDLELGFSPLISPFINKETLLNQGLNMYSSQMCQYTILPYCKQDVQKKLLDFVEDKRKNASPSFYDPNVINDGEVILSLQNLNIDSDYVRNHVPKIWKKDEGLFNVQVKKSKNLSLFTEIILKDFKYQSQNCASCYALTVKHFLQLSSVLLKNQSLLKFETEELIQKSKNYGSYGCQGGQIENVLEYINEDKKILNYEIIKNIEVDQLKQLVDQKPVPVWVCLDSVSLKSFQFYGSGFYDECFNYDQEVKPLEDCKFQHTALLVGYIEYNKSYPIEEKIPVNEDYNYHYEIGNSNRKSGQSPFEYDLDYIPADEKAYDSLIKQQENERNNANQLYQAYARNRRGGSSQAASAKRRIQQATAKIKELQKQKDQMKNKKYFEEITNFSKKGIVWKILNSWGQDWGVDGMMYIPQVIEEKITVFKTDDRESPENQFYGEDHYKTEQFLRENETSKPLNSAITQQYPCGIGFKVYDITFQEIDQ